MLEDILNYYRDGKITTDELYAVLQKNNGLSEEKARELCKLLDFDQDGSLDLDELKQVCYISIAKLFVQNTQTVINLRCHSIAIENI